MVRLLIIFLALVVGIAPALPAQKNAPNVLFIVVDDLNDWKRPL